MPASSSVCRSKPRPVTWRPANSGPSRRKASGSWSMTATLCPTSSSRRAMAEPTRPQPITTTCTRTPREASSRRRRPPARTGAKLHPAGRRAGDRPSPCRAGRADRHAARRDVRTHRAVPSLSDLGQLPKRLVLGRPVRSDRAGESLLPKRLALPIFASDALSSVAYATQEILIILTLGGTAYLFLAPWVAAGVGRAADRGGASYRQVVHAYPSGGGDYEVAMKNHGQFAGARGGQRAAGRLRADRGGVGLLRHGQHHLGVPGPRPAPGADRARPGRAAGGGQPARCARVGQDVRRPDVPVRRRRAGA